MAKTVDVPVPDIGDFEDVDVIEVLVSPGDAINKDDSLITLESEKATMEVPSPHAGTIKEVKVGVGDRVSEGDLIATMEVAGAEAGEEQPGAGAQTPEAEGEAQPSGTGAEAPGAQAAAAESTAGEHGTEVLVLGAGPGGYSAAFRAADLGKRVTLVERYPSLGGVCLNVGCIPSKALLHVGQVLEEAAQMKDWGVRLGEPEIDTDQLRSWKDGVVNQLTSGLRQLAKRRGVDVIQGTGRFVGPHRLAVESDDETTVVAFEHAIVAAGARAIQLPGFPHDDPRVMDSTAALEVEEIPGRLLVVGGGIIGMEMATLYQALGSRVTVVELSDALIPGADRDIVKPLQKRAQSGYDALYLNTQVTALDADEQGLTAHLEGPKAPETARFDRVLVAVGRHPNSDRIGAAEAGLELDDQGLIPVDEQMRSNVGHIFAIGDIVAGPQLAHKASHEGKVAAEVIAGLRSGFEGRVIPSVAYTDPEVAWVGLTEGQAKEQGIDYGKGSFPWAASGRSLSFGRNEGVTKLLFDRESGRLLGAGIVGPYAGELIAEAALAIEMGADARDIGLTIHPHPTLSETVGMAAEAFEGTITDLYIPKR